MDKRQIRTIFLYEFKLGKTAAETARNINDAFGRGTANERMVQLWFKRFPVGDITLEDKDGRGSWQRLHC